MKSKRIELQPEIEIPDAGELPDGWRYVLLGDVCTYPQYGWTTSTDHNPQGLKIVRTSDISCGKIDWSTVPSCVNEPDAIEKYLLKSGDILISRAGSVGTSYKIQECPRSVFASYLIRFRALDSIDAEYLRYFLKSRQYWDAIADETIGITIPNVNATKLKNIPIPLPPLAEQQRIVARVEALLTSVNAARDRLSRVPLIMKKFRQAVLAAACSGWLTDEPDGYESRSAGELFTDARYGTSNKCDYTKEQKIPVLRIPNIATGKLELTDLKFGDLTDKEIQKLAVQEGDLIICRTNGSLDLVGKAAIIPYLSKQFVFASYLIRVRVNQCLLLPEYYHICLTGQIGRDHIEEMARSTAGQFNLNLEILRTMPIPLPPLAEQHEIVRRVGLLFERADAIDREVAAAGRRCERLTQAVLGKAFSGKL